MKYSGVKRQVYSPFSTDLVQQHMSYLHMKSHNHRINSAKSWESGHVNPGCKQRSKSQQNTNNNVVNINMNKLKQKLTPNGSSNEKLKTTFNNLNKTKMQICHHTIQQKWLAHELSHLRQSQGQSKQPSNYQQKYSNNIQSRLKCVREYQAPRKANIMGRNGTSDNAETKASRCSWSSRSSRTPSMDRFLDRAHSSSIISLSTSCDSAYEAGGSSPPSRCSTPKPCRDTPRSSVIPSLPHNGDPHGSTPSSFHEPSLSKSSLTSSDPNEINLPKDPAYSSEHVPEDIMHGATGTQEFQNLVGRFTQITFEPLNSDENLCSVAFEHQIIDEINSSGILTNAVVKEILQSHFNDNKFNLDKRKVEEIYSRLLKLLDIPPEDEMDSFSLGLGSPSYNQ